MRGSRRWTDPEFRGQGNAAAVTAAWAAMLAPAGRRLFYNTSADNLSSPRSLPARLELRLIGWLWTVCRVRGHRQAVVGERQRRFGMEG